LFPFVPEINKQSEKYFYLQDLDYLRKLLKGLTQKTQMRKNEILCRELPKNSRHTFQFKTQMLKKSKTQMKRMEFNVGTAPKFPT
jgi:hypothetical protein